MISLTLIACANLYVLSPVLLTHARTIRYHEIKIEYGGAFNPVGISDRLDICYANFYILLSPVPLTHPWPLKNHVIGRVYGEALPSLGRTVIG